MKSKNLYDFNLKKLKNFIMKGGSDGTAAIGWLMSIICCIVATVFGILFAMKMLEIGLYSPPTCKDTTDTAYCVQANIESPDGGTTPGCEDKENPLTGTKPVCHCKPGWTGLKCDTPNLGVCMIKDIETSTGDFSYPSGTEGTTGWDVINTVECPAGKCTKDVCQGTATVDGIKYCDNVVAGSPGTCITELEVGEILSDTTEAAQANVDSAQTACTAHDGKDACNTDTCSDNKCRWLPEISSTQVDLSSCDTSDTKVAVWIPNEIPLPPAS